VGGKDDYRPASSAEVKDAWSYTSICAYAFMASSLIDQKDNIASPLPMKIKSLVYVIIKSGKCGTPYLSQFPSSIISVIHTRYNGVPQHNINNHPYHPSPHLNDEKWQVE
jgi:hypothetical protein